MKVNSGNSINHLREHSEESCSKWTGPEFDAAKNIQDNSDLAQAQSVANDAKSAMDASSVLRRSMIDQDLEQSDNCIKQQILEYPSGS